MLFYNKLLIKCVTDSWFKWKVVLLLWIVNILLSLFLNWGNIVYCSDHSITTPIDETSEIATDSVSNKAKAPSSLNSVRKVETNIHVQEGKVNNNFNLNLDWDKAYKTGITLGGIAGAVKAIKTLPPVSRLTGIAVLGIIGATWSLGSQLIDLDKTKLLTEKGENEKTKAMKIDEVTFSKWDKGNNSSDTIVESSAVELNNIESNSIIKFRDPTSISTPISPEIESVKLIGEDSTLIIKSALENSWWDNLPWDLQLLILIFILICVVIYLLLGIILNFIVRNYLDDYLKKRLGNDSYIYKWIKGGNNITVILIMGVMLLGLIISAYFIYKLLSLKGAI